MSRSNRPYPLEFRQQMFELVRAGRTPEELLTCPQCPVTQHESLG